MFNRDALMENARALGGVVPRRCQLGVRGALRTRHGTRQGSSAESCLLRSFKMAGMTVGRKSRSARVRLIHQVLVTPHDTRHIAHGLAERGDVPAIAFSGIFARVIGGKR